MSAANGRNLHALVGRLPRVQGGVTSTDLVLSCHRGGNADVFPLVLRLHVAPGAKVADVTHGGGVFWRNVPTGTYDLRATDIRDGVDCRSLPYADGEMDAVVLDPPYMEGATRNTAYATGQSQFADYYGLKRIAHGDDRYHGAILRLYLDAAKEAKRVLRNGGTLIVKCMDEVCANRQRLTHVELVSALEADGMVCKDLFVVMRTNRPCVSRIKRQVHARKNHSYFLVFVKGARYSANKKKERQHENMQSVRRDSRGAP